MTLLSWLLCTWMGMAPVPTLDEGAEEMARLASELRRDFRAAQQALAKQEYSEARVLVGSIVERAQKAEGGKANRLVSKYVGEAYWLASDLGMGDTALAAAYWVLDAERLQHGEDHENVVEAMLNVAAALDDLDRSAEAMVLYREGLRRNVEQGRGDTLRHHQKRSNMAVCLENLGFVDEAVEIFGESYRQVTQLTPASEWNHALATFHYARVLLLLKGDLKEAAKLFDHIYTLPALTDPGLRSTVDYHYVQLLEEQGDIAGANTLAEDLLARRMKMYPEGHPLIRNVQLMTATFARTLGQLERANELIASASVDRGGAQQALEQLDEWRELAPVKAEEGDHAGAKELYRKIIDYFEGLGIAEDSRLLSARRELSRLLVVEGKFGGARELLESNMATHRRLEHDDRSELATKRALASCAMQAGDIYAALDIQRELLAELETRRNAGDDEVIQARRTMAMLHDGAGEAEQALALLQHNLALLEKRFRPGHFQVIRARLDVAYVLPAERRRESIEAALEAKKALQQLGARVNTELWATNMAAFNLVRGTGPMPEEDAALAESLLDESLRRCAERVRQGVMEPGKLEGVRRIRMKLYVRTEQRDKLKAELRSHLDELENSRIETYRQLGRRAGLAYLTDDRRRGISALLEFSRDLGADDIDRRLFEVFETMRGLITGAEPAPDPAGGAAEPVDAVDPRCSVSRLISSLPANSAYVSVVDADAADLVAFVVTSEGGFRRVSLGAQSEIEAMVERWIEPAADLVAARGVTTLTGPGRAASASKPGEELRQRVLDPILASIAPGTTIHLCPAGPLHQFHPGTLPGAEALVGETYPIRFEVSAGRLLAGVNATTSGDALVLIGNVDFGTSTAGSNRFQPLPGTAREIEAIDRLWQAVHAGGPPVRKPVALTGDAASKDGFRTVAAGAAYLHVATHGYFDREAASGFVEPFEPGWSEQDDASIAVGLSPLELNGLALAGANVGNSVNKEGVKEGVLTARELCELPLHGCRLAVLSACESSAGLARRGQGMHSLRSALHRAGVRASITALWPVPDDSTARLMQGFYRRLWKDGETKADALWHAQLELRQSGAPFAAWAGWILTGDPE